MLQPPLGLVALAATAAANDPSGLTVPPAWLETDKIRYCGGGTGWFGWPGADPLGGGPATPGGCPGVPYNMTAAEGIAACERLCAPADSCLVRRPLHYNKLWRDGRAPPSEQRAARRVSHGTLRTARRPTCRSAASGPARSPTSRAARPVPPSASRSRRRRRRPPPLRHRSPSAK